MRSYKGAAVAVVVAGLLTGCAPGSTSGTAPSPTPTAESQVTFASVVDGDTIETSAGTIRIIGIDAPQGGECGYDEASALISSLLSPGDPTVLTLPDGENDTDQCGRSLRYVDAAQGVDVALSLLTAGLAAARYDSTDPTRPQRRDRCR